MLQTKGRPAIYNPANQTDAEIISNFVIRLQEFQDLFEEIKNNKMETPPQHFIIQGQRGYGKTTLLLRLNLEVKKDPELKHWLIPVMFDEEQYSIRNLAGFWEKVIAYLEDQEKSFAGLSEKVDALYDTDSPEEEIFNLLISALKEKNKKLVILLDNFGEMTQKFEKKEHQRLREVLITCNDIRLIGASSTVLEFYYDYKEPFFDFFKVITLDELSQEETVSLLRKLAETYGSEEIENIIKTQPERIESIRRLTGGVPRTIVLLYEIFVDSSEGNSIKDLETILDYVTPLYKHRLDNLSTQQQVIIDAIAQSWDAISTKDIAKAIRMESKAVSSQLSQLEKAQLIKKITTSTKNNLYQVSERFFNIYYLMRIGRRNNRQRVLWLIKFFEVWCGEQELIDRVNKHLKALKENKIYDKGAFIITQALAGTKIPGELQHELIIETRKYLTIKESGLCEDLVKSHIEIYDEVVSLIKDGNEEMAKQMLRDDGAEITQVDYKIGILFHIVLKDFRKAEKYYLISVEQGNSLAMQNLGVMYQEYKDFSKAKKYYMMAAKKGSADAMQNLGLLYQQEYKDFSKAEEYFLMSLKNGNNDALHGLGILYQVEYKNYLKAEEYYQMSIKNGNAGAMNNLAALYQNEYRDLLNSEKYYKMAIEKGNAEAAYNLANLYLGTRKNKEKALELVKKSFDKIKYKLNFEKKILIFLWNNEIEDAINEYEEIINNEEFQKEINIATHVTLLMFIAKKQYNFVYNLFTENKFNIKDKYKPVFYALLTFMGEEYNDELLKMGSELKETVDEIVASINQLAEDYK